MSKALIYVRERVKERAQTKVAEALNLLRSKRGHNVNEVNYIYKTFKCVIMEGRKDVQDEVWRQRPLRAADDAQRALRIV